MGSRDTRRVLGPDKSVGCEVLQPLEPLPFLKQDGRRRDGRLPHHSRKLFMSVGMITQAKGSSYIEVGNTKVCCGVYGPKDVQRGQDFKMAGQVLCTVKMAPFSCLQRLSPQPDKRQQEMSRQLKNTLESIIILEKFPKSQIDVFVTVIEDAGSLLASCVTAAGLALCHANIDVYDMVVGSSMLWHNNKLYTTPPERRRNTAAQEEEEGGDSGGGGGGGDSGGGGGGLSQLTVGMIPKHAGGQVALLVQGGGQMSPSNLSSGLEMAADLCTGLHALGPEDID
ncbi:Exosome complex component MTR3 [Chionoecetes opilio]|uniref:Exosome complex component MTR3 n=1 Tax=Chionoecetes opilio TaxID=41210 RepID=A0A8J4XPY1_CHIOP|nr:Exosome complex component MTR3 [Chionoecetes opilio]